MSQDRIIPPSPGAVSGVLARLREGADPGALDELLPLVYDELRILARRQRRRAGAAETLAALKARGFGVGLISNTGRTPGSVLRAILGELGLAASIDVMVFSNEHGHCKPRPSIFEELRRGLDVRYEEMVFVGDNLYADVHGAQSCGMRAVHFDPPTRGTAVAPHVEHGLTIVADARVTTFGELLAAIETMNDER